MVRRIFQLTIEGKGPYDIARILFDDKINTPAVYFGKQNKASGKARRSSPTPITGAATSLADSLQAGVYGAYGEFPFPQAVL